MVRLFQKGQNCTGVRGTVQEKNRLKEAILYVLMRSGPAPWACLDDAGAGVFGLPAGDQAKMFMKPPGAWVPVSTKTPRRKIVGWVPRTSRGVPEGASGMSTTGDQRVTLGKGPRADLEGIHSCRPFRKNASKVAGWEQVSEMEN